MLKVSKRRVLAAITKQRGLVTKIAEQCQVHPATIYDYIKSDPEIAKALEDAREHATDHVESKLFDQIEQGNITAIIFYLKTQGKRRGYVERLEIDDRRDAEEKAKSIAEARGLNVARILAIAEDIVSRNA